MDAPDIVPVPETEVSSTVDVSIDLIAPAEDGAYTANFELRNAEGEVIPLGTEPTFWVKIVVGEEMPSASEQTIGNCTYTENPEYVQTLIDLINQARADVGRPALTVNAELTEAARRHSLDMACSNFMKHSGSDGSWTGDRVTDAGYTEPYYLEILAIGLPQDAMNQWRIEKSGLERRAQLTRHRDRRGLCIFEVQRLWRLLDGGDGRTVMEKVFKSICSRARNITRIYLRQ